MRGWKKWNAERSMGRIKIDWKATRQFVKMHKKLYSKFHPFKGYKREYRNRNARARLRKKAWALTVKRNGVW